MDPGRPKNQSYRNQTKLTPLCWSRRADSNHIYFFPKMDTVCESYRVLIDFPDKQKKSQSQQSTGHTADVRSMSA
jgi:hypothetical protein